MAFYVLMDLKVHQSEGVGITMMIEDVKRRRGSESCLKRLIVSCNPRELRGE